MGRMGGRLKLFFYLPQPNYFNFILITQTSLFWNELYFRVYALSNSHNNLHGLPQKHTTLGRKK
jgi:hypothetical protein